jgi:ABC-type iron transport system FetAB permease component
MTGIALGPNTLTTSLMLRRASVEAQLMLGATRWDATADSALSDWNNDEIGESRRI